MENIASGSNVPSNTPNPDELHQAFTSLALGKANPEVQVYAAQEVQKLREQIERQERAYEEMRTLYNIEHDRAENMEAQRNLFRTHSRSGSRSPHVPINIDDDENTMDFESTPKRPVIPLKKPGNEILPNTKAMKTFTRNLLQKLARLRARLVKVAAANTPALAKKYYQFRLISEDNSEIKIFEDNRKALDNDIAQIVTKVLAKDLDEQITAVKTQLDECVHQLKKELEDTKEQHLAAPDLTDEEKTSIIGQWDTNIKYNVDWYCSELTKMKTTSLPKVCKSSDVREYVSRFIALMLAKIQMVSFRLHLGTPETPTLASSVDDHNSTQNAHPQPQEAPCPRTEFKGYKKGEGL
jgi:hypothetical protein